MPTVCSLSRRAFFLGAAATLAGCATTETSVKVAPVPQKVSYPIVPAADEELAARYAAVEDGGHLIPAIPYTKIDPKYYRQRVKDPTGEAPGTVVVDTPGRFLYVVEPGGTAMRYGVGIGREGFAWEGEGIIHWRQPWPRWKVPADMIARTPSLAKYSVENGGMEPGIKNPLGARALYIFQNGKDTLYRLHGSPDWASIGKATSSGCVRLINQDVLDLYKRVPYHARIVVHQGPMGAAVGA
ncbi:L,D-transpeptidase family protein [Shinella kummerowiae]|jgi:lipoprotein-anchoring transpeptidase ErfK/SrfK|uniref:L,D-transpeptidase family protein n=1 Tax=Shinella kummerowiae TaxID=417745 RepID=A0A6N8SBC1_9HYPH|nr:L,D-transpeptidase [Shinella kummerowiae]MXN43980.1 L,D-transpeptidase family protein [Shinella kummerowiae]